MRLCERAAIVPEPAERPRGQTWAPAAARAGRSEPSSRAPTTHALSFPPCPVPQSRRNSGPACTHASKHARTPRRPHTTPRHESPERIPAAAGSRRASPRSRRRRRGRLSLLLCRSGRGRGGLAAVAAVAARATLHRGVRQRSRTRHGQPAPEQQHDRERKWTEQS